MAEKRREKLRQATQAEIKDIARKLMTQNGTAGLGLRAIAREMDVTAPAIYRYFPSLDDLITELIIENFHAQAAAMTDGAASAPEQDYAGRLMGMLLAYRRWALDHPIDFQLIYGNPIPGYVAPAERTMPAARRGFDVVVDILAAALADGALVPPPEYQALPGAIATQLSGVNEHEGYNVPVVVLYLATVGWTRIHGIVMLELFDNIQPVVGDTEAFYRFEMHMLLKQLGYKNTS
ncbi:MAG: TetR/AcrR family transcriptional regulator [Anaerolineae bacterium]|nr:TetR/AcrR family transcriptional regulator [Anaerolineae bacterium]